MIRSQFHIILQKNEKHRWWIGMQYSHRRRWYEYPLWKFRRLMPKRVRQLLIIPLIILAIGTIGYPLIEGQPWTLFDGLYMSVITLTTLGYGEIPEPLSKPGRAFTMALALGGIFVLFYIAGELIRTVVTGELRDLLGKERMNDELKHMSQHTIVCGFGRMGRIVCAELERLKQRFVVIDSASIAPDVNFSHGLAMQGDATEDEVLRRAGIERARSVITVVGSDAQNLYITLSARLLNPKLFIVARAEEEPAEAKLNKVGANKVISPYLSGGHRAVQAVFKPGVLHFMDIATRREFAGLQLEEIKIESNSLLANQCLRDCNLNKDLGVMVVGMLQPDGKVLTRRGATRSLRWVRC